MKTYTVLNQSLAAGDPPEGDYSKSYTTWTRDMLLWILRKKGVSAGSVKDLNELRKLHENLLKREGRLSANELYKGEKK